MQVPIPEFGLEEKWDSTSIITELRETTAETQIDITPKLSVNGSDYATLVNVMYNGSAQLPFVADATVTDNSGKTAEIRCATIDPPRCLIHHACCKSKR